MTEANLNPSDSPKWFKEYSFKDAFDLHDLSPKSLAKMLENWKKDTAQLTKVITIDGLDFPVTFSLVNSCFQYWEYKVKHSDFFLAKGCDAKCLDVHRQEATCEIESNFF